MKLFVDTQNRAWHINVDIESCRRCREMADVDLINIPLRPEIAEQLSEVVNFVNVLYAIVEPQARAVGVSDTDFAKGLDFPSLQTAAAVLEEELQAFFGCQKLMALWKTMNPKQRERMHQIFGQVSTHRLVS